MLGSANAHNEGIVTELFDAICIAPYRLVANPVAGFYLGTLVLALASLVLGRLTYDLAWLFNRGHYAKEEAEMVRMADIIVLDDVIDAGVVIKRILERKGHANGVSAWWPR